MKMADVKDIPRHCQNTLIMHILYVFNHVTLVYNYSNCVLVSKSHDAVMYVQSFGIFKAKVSTKCYNLRWLNKNTCCTYFVPFFFQIIHKNRRLRINIHRCCLKLKSDDFLEIKEEIKNICYGSCSVFRWYEMLKRCRSRPPFLLIIIFSRHLRICRMC